MSPHHPAECNNALIFPGIGLGAVLSRSTTISDKMIVSATKALASLSPALTDIDKGLLPNISTTKEISCKVAMAVVKTAVEEGSARVLGIPVGEEGALEGWVRRQMWGARYRELREVCVRDDGK